MSSGAATRLTAAELSVVVQAFSPTTEHPLLGLLGGSYVEETLLCGLRSLAARELVAVTPAGVRFEPMAAAIGAVTAAPERAVGVTAVGTKGQGGSWVLERGGTRFSLSPQPPGFFVCRPVDTAPSVGEVVAAVCARILDTDPELRVAVNVLDGDRGRQLVVVPDSPADVASFVDLDPSAPDGGT